MSCSRPTFSTYCANGGTHDLSRSLMALGQNSTIIAAVELSQRSQEV
jgi:hypothetical protein